MMLREIKELLAEHGRLSLKELAVHFAMEQEALEPMLDLLERKGQIRVVGGGCSKGNCRGCSCADRGSMLLYELKK